jgi:tRNA threonylcarbamoyladenosine biosynthesis protein TsaE
MKRTTTAGPAETEAVAAELAAELAPGDVVLVEGGLGAGKTTFVRGAARALGVTEPVTSPTFTLGQIYEGAGERGRRLAIAHLDLYRLADSGEEEPGLLDDYFGADRITFVEWPAAGERGPRPIRCRVRLEHAGGDRRQIEIRE